MQAPKTLEIGIFRTMDAYKLVRGNVLSLTAMDCVGHPCCDNYCCSRLLPTFFCVVTTLQCPIGVVQHRVGLQGVSSGSKTNWGAQTNGLRLF